MVALNKTYRKTLTPDRSAKDSGLRYYSPEISRWLNRDPVGERGGLNLHAFVRNSPIRGFDILGLMWPEPGTPGNIAGWDVGDYGGEEDVSYCSPSPPESSGGGASAVLNAVWSWAQSTFGPGVSFEMGLTTPFGDLIEYVGEQAIGCCDQDNLRHLAVYKKKCVGTALGFSAAADAHVHLDGSNCPEGWEGWFFEMGIGLVEWAIPVADADGNWLNPFSGQAPSSVGLAVGLSAKVAFCEYNLHFDLVTGCCDE